MTPELNLTGVLEPPRPPAGRAPAPRRREPAAQLPPVNPQLDSFVNDVIGEASTRTGYTYRLGEGSRTPEQQAQKVAGGFSRTYNSKHLSGRGRDVLAFDSSGAYITDGSHEAYKALGDVYREKSAAAGLPIKWGGDFKDFYDPGHFELDGDDSTPALKLNGVLEPPLKLDGVLEPVDTEEVVSTEAAVEGATGKSLALDDPRRRQKVDASTVQFAPPSSSLPSPSQRKPFDVRTMEGRAERDASAAAERDPGGRYLFDIELPKGKRDWSEVTGNELARIATARAAAQRGVPDEFIQQWMSEHGDSLKYYDLATGREQQPIDSVGTPEYDEERRTIRVHQESPLVAQLVDDYKASRGAFKRLGDWATSDETSPGEKFVDAAGTALKPVAVAADYIGRVPRAWSTAFWSGYNSDSPTQTVGAIVDVYAGRDPGEVAKNPLAEGVRHNQLLGRLNPRLPSYLGGITEAVVDPANLVPLGAAGKLLRGAGRLAEGGRAAGVLDRGLVEARPLRLLLEEAAAKGAASAPDDLLRSAGYTVETVSAPNRTAGGAAREAFKVTAPDGRVNIMRDESELADFAEGFAQRAREAASSPSNVAGLAEARARYEYHVEQAAHAPSRAARENAQALADDYAKEIARLEGGSAAAGADGIDVHPSRFQPRTPAGEFNGPPRPLWQRILSNARAAVQLPKAKAGFDLSATGRQGLAQVLAHPSYLKEAMVHQVRAFASEDAFNAFRSEIMGRADFQQMKDSGLFLSSVGPEAEEAFASKFAQRIPGVRGSDRAYSAALDSIRTQAWDNYVASLPEHLRDNPDTLKAVADLINISTGRGTVAILDRTALGKKVIDLLNVPFFSPRNTASKFNLISPTRIVKNMIDPATRPVAYLQLRDATQGLVTLGTTLGLLHVAGADVGINPNSPDFGKLRVGKAVYDLTGGEGYTVRYLAQMADAVRRGKADDPRRGVVALTKRYLRTQLQPLAAGAVDVGEGTDVQGRPVTLSGAAVDLVTPFVVDDVIKGFQAEGWLGAAKATPGVLGVGVNFYDKPKREKRGGSAPQLNLEGVLEPVETDPRGNN